MSLFSIGNLKKIWQKIWGKDLPEDITEIFPDDKSKSDVNVNLYNKLKKRIKIKRFIICILFLCVLMLIINRILSYCRNIDIYMGPNSNYFHYDDPMYAKISDNETFIMHYRRLFKEQCDAEIYLTKENKFNKVADFRKLVPIIPSIKFNNPMQSKMLNMTKNDSNEIIMIDYLQPIHKYNLKNKKYINTHKDYISSKEYVYLTPYRNKILLMSNFNNFEYPSNKGVAIYNYEGIASKELKKKENLYLLNTNTLELENFSNFDVMPKRVPISSDIICLKDGTIIIPIRYKEKRREFESFKEKVKECSNFNKKCENDYIWDHVEIYNPETKLFKAEFNTDVLKDNLFNFELENGNILFINQKDSYIFDIKTHSFIKADELTQRNCQIFIKRVNNILKRHMGMKLEEPSTQRLRYIKLNEKQYFLSCGRQGYLFKDFRVYEIFGYMFSNPIRTCHKSVIADFGKLKAQIGPNFEYSHYEATAIPVNNNKVLFVGGAPHVKSLNTQILEIKEK